MFAGQRACTTTFDNMKRLGGRAAFLSTDNNAEA
jgi:hypothetical protein